MTHVRYIHVHVHATSMYVHVDTNLGAWSMAFLLRQDVEYYS